MTTTPTASDLATLRTDLQRVAHLLATANDAHRRGLDTETLVALERASVLVDGLGEVLDWWRFANTDAKQKPLPTFPPPEFTADTTILDEPADELHERAFACNWQGCDADTFATAQALASHKRKHARDQLKAEAHDLRVEAEAAAAKLPPAPVEATVAEVPPLAVVADPAPDEPADEPREMHGTTEQIGVYEIRTIGKRRFLRCGEVMCGRRILLTDEATQSEVADAVHSHTVSGECLARATAGRR